MSPRRRVLGTIAAPLVLVTACSGSGSPGTGGTTSLDPSNLALVSYDGCDAVLEKLRAAGERQVGPYGLGGGVPQPARRGVPEGDTRADGAVPGPGADSAVPKAPEQHSRTNAHEAGADEPDLVKTDGRRIVTLARGRLHVIDPATRRIVHRLDVPGAHGSRLLLSGDRALVLTRGAGMIDLMPELPEPRRSKPVPRPVSTVLTLIDLAGTPRVLGSVETSADYVDARQSGSIARVVVRSEPRIDFPGLPRSPQAERDALERNRRIVRSAPLDAWLPTFQVRDAADRATGTYKTPCEHISHPRDGAGTTMLSVLTFDLAKGLGDPAPVSVAADGQTVYGNGRNLYVTSTAPRIVEGRMRHGEHLTTRIHKFRTDGAQRPRYVASGEVPGDLLNQYSMSEHGGRLRVATTTARVTTRTSQSGVYVLSERNGRLERTGGIEGLGKGERIYSVRFIGTTGYVVTFRQVDPLYVLDLRDPSRPRLTGELKITGYSAYLHPTADGKLLGVGQEADLDGRTRGLQVSLFDVSGAPRRVSAYHLPSVTSAAEFDPHAFLHWPRTGLTVLPVMSKTGSGGRALILRVGGGNVERVGAVTHPAAGPGATIQRSLVVGDTLWTLSDAGARAIGITALDDRGWLAF